MKGANFLMDIIKQTNRAILFEEINPEKLDLMTLIGDTRGVDSLNDDKIKEINEHLLVSSFEEFVTKFSPKVYSFFNASTQRVMYTLQKPEGLPDSCISEIPLNLTNDFLKMLVSLIEAKRAQGTINVDFKFENVLDMISPKKVMDDIRRSRKELQYTYSEYSKLEDADPAKLDVGDKLNLMFEEASENYNNIMAMLPLAIEDIKTRLLLGNPTGGDSGEEFKAGILSMGEDGELKIIEAPKEESTSLAAIEDSSSTDLVAALAEDYEAITEDAASSYVQDLVVRTFCPLSNVVSEEIDFDKEVANYNTYLKFYKESKEDFVKTVKPLIEKLLGVKMYFDQYTIRKGMNPTLLISNVKPDVVSQAAYIKRLDTYFNTVNAKNDFKNTVWFAIIPSVGLDAANKANIRRERFKGNKAKSVENTPMEVVVVLLQALAKFKVQAFFNFENSEEVTFNAVATKGVTHLIDKCESLASKDYSEFAVPCVPNFTIIPKEKSGVVLDSKMLVNDGGTAEMSKDKEDIMKLWIEGIYVGAAYVACGLVSAYQCPEFLKTRLGRNVSPTMPGVRFDIELGDFSLKVPTAMAKEITGFTNNIKDDINKNNFGFMFSSDPATVGGSPVSCVTVSKARSMSFDGYTYDSIYKTLASTYIERILRFLTNDFKQDGIVNFFSNNPGSQKSKWLSAKNFVNSIIKEGDDIGFSISDEDQLCNINITFNGNTKNLAVAINRTGA